MPAQRYPAFLEPDELDRLTALCDAALRELSTSGVDLGGEGEVELIKKIFAQRILLSSVRGKIPDPENLKKQVLRSLRRRPRTPFHAYASHFGPEELDALTAAYSAAWQQLWAMGIALSRAEAQLVRKKLAQVILATACTGERKIERLQEAALRALSTCSALKAKAKRRELDRDPDECRESALRCSALAARATTAEAKRTFAQLAKAWAELASELERPRAE